jgi:hypothetical protein
MDVRRKGAPKGNVLYLDNEPFEFSRMDSADAIYAYLEKSEEARAVEWAMQSVADNGSVERAIRRLEEKLFDALEGDYPMDRRALAWLKANKGRVEVKKLAPHNLYKQAFCPISRRICLTGTGRSLKRRSRKSWLRWIKTRVLRKRITKKRQDKNLGGWFMHGSLLVQLLKSHVFLHPPTHFLCEYS